MRKKSKRKRKAKQGAQAKKPRRNVFEGIAPEQATLTADSGSAAREEQTQPPQVIEIDEPKVVVESAARAKRPRTKGEPSHHPGLSSSDDIWDPELMVRLDLVSVHHTVLDTSDVELSAKVAHALARAAYLPGDI